MNKDRVMIVAGTRPEIIKLAPIIWGLESGDIDYSWIWTGQHYDRTLTEVFFNELVIRRPDVDLKVGSRTHSGQTAAIMVGLEREICAKRPKFVIAEGDTNSVLAAALVASKTNTPFAHVESGLRSFDRGMPEEVNRVVADHLSTILFAPSSVARGNLRREGIRKSVYLTGNTIVDVYKKFSSESSRRGKEIVRELGLPKDFILVTIHRAENTDIPSRLNGIIDALAKVAETIEVVFPIHPRTRKRLGQGQLDNLRRVKLIEPLGYFEFIGLLRMSRLVLTDSGGVQEEALMTSTPCITARANTERPETVTLGANYLVGSSARGLARKTLLTLLKADEVRRKIRHVKNPYGDGLAGEKILNVLSARTG